MKVRIVAVVSVLMNLEIELSVIRVKFVGIFGVDRAIKRKFFF